MNKPVAVIALASITALVLSGCSSKSEAGAADDGLIQVVATTNVYGALAEQIGGDRVEVTSLLTSTAQDPHSYEASARDRLSVQNADLVIENGGGYDSFMDTLLGDSDAHVLTAVEFAHDYPGNEGHDAAEEEDPDHADDEEDAHASHDHIEGFNEHIWFDPHTMIHVVEGIADELTEIDPGGAADFTAASEKIVAELETAEADLEELHAEFDGTSVFITEPLPGYIAAAAGLTDVTPEGFAESVEEGNDVAPSALLAALNVIDSGEVKALLTNAQTGGAETQRVEDAAKAAGIPVIAFTELLEDGSSYAGWMHDAIQNLAAALSS